MKCLSKSGVEVLRKWAAVGSLKPRSVRLNEGPIAVTIELHDWLVQLHSYLVREKRCSVSAVEDLIKACREYLNIGV